MRTIIFLCLFWANAATAQTYPDYQSTTVNDYANLLNATEEVTLNDQLNALRRETGVEMTVLTIISQRQYAPNIPLERFATGLFNHWGVGKNSTNDGVLILIIRNDRAMRIELGAAYGQSWNSAASQIVQREFVPKFAVGDYGEGIVQGSAAIEAEIVRPYLTGDPAPGTPTFNDFGIFALFAAGMGLLAGRQRIGDTLTRIRTCPNCGRRGLRQRRRIQQTATTSNNGSGIRRRWCLHCDYETQNSYTISRVTKSSFGGFGGGRSGGGGASGRW